MFVSKKYCLHSLEDTGLVDLLIRVGRFEGGRGVGEMFQFFKQGMGEGTTPCCKTTSAPWNGGKII